MNRKLESWKRQLLDLGKRNRLINFKETKRSNIHILEPNYEMLFEDLVTREKSLSFPCPQKVKFDEDGEESFEQVFPGDLQTNKATNELLKTLKVLRGKAKESIEEQGVNTLYLTFGLVRWNENDLLSKQFISSPLLLVPVTLTIESITSPYYISLHEDEIVINPSLKYKFFNDFGINLPDFDDSQHSIVQYLKLIEKTIDNENWIVKEDVHLTLLSFLKINMYKDLERNEGKISTNVIIEAISGNGDSIYPNSEYNNYDHDRHVKPLDTYQVLDADSSQQDAILLSKKGVSFVLQGPPGTGKSQTITNIISEALADKKKVLFVAEKMAALQVVHKRLTNVGLEDFCLKLHSHKANKKEILGELNNTLLLNKIKIREDALYQLRNLEKSRENLNLYNVQLHTKCSPLDKTIFEINGLLAQIHATPDLMFDIDNVSNITVEILNEQRYLLDQFSKTIGRMTEDFSANPWYNSKVKSVNHKLRSDIDANLSNLSPGITYLCKIFNDVLNEFNIPLDHRYSDVNRLIEILKLSKKSPNIPDEWIFDGNIKYLREKACRSKKIQQNHINNVGLLSLKYKVAPINGNYKATKELLETNLNSLKSLLNNKVHYKNDEILNNLKPLRDRVKILSDTIAESLPILQDLSLVLGVESPTDFKSLARLRELIDLIATPGKPTDYWFSSFEMPVITSLYKEAKDVFYDHSRLKSKILREFDSEILTIDFRPILARFRVEYKSVWKYIKPSYWSDKKLILGLQVAKESKNDDESILTVLEDLNLCRERRVWIEENRKRLNDYYGTLFNEQNPSWDSIERYVSIFYKILSLFENEGIPSGWRNALLNSDLDIKELRSTFQSCKILSDDFEQKLNENLSVVNKINFKDFIPVLENIQSLCNNLISELQLLLKSPDNPIDYSILIRDLEELIVIEVFEENIKSSYADDTKDYFDRYDGLNTDWDSTILALDFAQSFKQLVDEYDLPDSFVKGICNDVEIVKYVGDLEEVLSKGFREVTPLLEWYIGLFELFEFDNVGLETLVARMEECQKRPSLLEEWIDFRETRESCLRVGLAGYVEKVEHLKIKPEQITDIYLKRFYRLWLDEFIKDFPAVNSFRRRNYEEAVAEFQKLDSSQIAIARSRIKEILISNLPDLNMATSSRDEVGILKRELTKQRKFLPIRKLFKAIPKLLITLKPCLMMSPLSVSVFLEADSYDFDMVIFDEASQIRTEDAIGTIMRGRQVIIVGDSNQLPPTSFFAATAQDDDFDKDKEDEENDSEAYESILDEAVKALPEKGLKWHYRSRHEHLIAFSNAEIYKHNLITFPSTAEKIPDHGVEHYYVENGVYDRGGKTNNIVEAKRVVELVKNHIVRYPNRSLGVVTFSATQKLAIDGLIDKLKAENSDLDHFFSAEKEEEFFVKNLENVQGDERDTIIFSVCYGRDASGKMIQNYGPIGRPGGARRLNVAITRAKYNVKLVSSIKPSDIADEVSSPQGVKLLRAYIDFAIKGESALRGKITSSDSITFDSPFEESVYEYLRIKGFLIATQVGCSGYRIDMAVRHPTLTGVFVLGVECDGATYHSSRTARDRDRLRQIVLEDIGWKIYRIWSTDWIKDPQTEGERLIEAIERAISTYEEPARVSEQIAGDDKHLFYEDIDLSNNLKPDSGFGFEEYKDAILSEVPRNSNPVEYIAGIIMHIVDIEYPIHFEYICKKLAPVLNNQRATSKIRDHVAFILKTELKGKIIREDDFLQPVNKNNIVARFSPPYETSRPINYISPKELAQALLLVAKKSYGIKMEDLLISTGRELGYKRITEGISESLKDVFNSLILTEKLKKDGDGKVVVV